MQETSCCTYVSPYCLSEVVQKNEKLESFILRSDSRVVVSPRGSTEGTNSSAGLQSVLLDPPQPAQSSSPQPQPQPQPLPQSNHNHSQSNGKKTTTFAALPQTTTTWQQQTQANLQQQADNSSDTGESRGCEH